MRFKDDCTAKQNGMVWAVWDTHGAPQCGCDVIYFEYAYEAYEYIDEAYTTDADFENLCMGYWGMYEL